MTTMPNAILRAAKQGQWSLVAQQLPELGPGQVNHLDGQGATLLMYAIAATDYDLVKQLIALGADVNLARPPHDITPLMLAAARPYHGDTETTKAQTQVAIAALLLERGALVNRGNDDGSTALMIAAYHNHGPMVACLLAAGADPNCQDQQGVTALQWAIKHQNLELVRRLLGRGARLDLANPAGHLPLTQAAQRGSLAIFQCLRGQGAKLDGASWFTAASEGQTAMVKIFLDQGWPINSADEHGDTALHFACLEGHGEVVEELLQRQARLDLGNRTGDSPLLLAIAQGEMAIVGRLLQGGASPNFAPGGESPLLATLVTEGLGMGMRLQLAELLLQHGAEPNFPLRAGKTLLMLAAEKNLVGLLNLFLQYGAAVNQTDQRGATALMWACHRGSLEAVAALLSCPSIDPHRKNAGGSTALELARLNQHWPIVQLLESQPI